MTVLSVCDRMPMAALVQYSDDSESADDSSEYLSESVDASDMPAVRSYDDDDSVRRTEDLSVLLHGRNNAGSLTQPAEQDSTVMLAVDDFFNLAEQTNVAEASDSYSAQHPCDSQLQSPSRSECTADFWNAEVPAEDWSHPEQIWGVNADLAEGELGRGNDRTATVVLESETTKIKGYSSKRYRSDLAAEMRISSATSDAVRKSYFTVHHKIAPHLHAVSRSANRVPRKVLRVLPGHAGTVNRIQWNKPEYSNLLATASMDATVRVWNVLTSSRADTCVCTLGIHSKAVRAALWSACGRRILSCSYDCTAKLTDVEHSGIYTTGLCSLQPAVLRHCRLGARKSIQPVKIDR